MLEGFSKNVQTVEVERQGCTSEVWLLMLAGDKSDAADGSVTFMSPIVTSP